MLDHTRSLWRSLDLVVQVENCRIELRSYWLENAYFGERSLGYSFVGAIIAMSIYREAVKRMVWLTQRLLAYPIVNLMIVSALCLYILTGYTVCVLAVSPFFPRQVGQNQNKGF